MDSERVRRMTPTGQQPKNPVSCSIVSCIRRRREIAEDREKEEKVPKTAVVDEQVVPSVDRLLT